MNTSGLVRVPDEAEEQEEETVLIRDISDLEDGQVDITGHGGHA